MWLGADNYGNKWFGVSFGCDLCKTSGNFLAWFAETTQQIYPGMKPWHEVRLMAGKRKMKPALQTFQSENNLKAEETIALSFPVEMRQVPGH